MTDAKTVKSLEKKIESLNKTIESLEKKIEEMNKRMSDVSKNDMRISDSRGLTVNRHVSYSDSIERIKGKHREILVMLINEGFHTYGEIASKLDISQSRVRAYISDLKNKYHIPLSRIRDAEGYKVGVDMRFVER